MPGTCCPKTCRNSHWQGPCKKSETEGSVMLWTIFVILLVLWLLGMVTSYTLYGFIHILLVIAVVVLIIRLLQGRSAL